MTTPDTSQAPAPALPALAAFPFPTALVVTGRSAAGDGVLLEAGDVDEIFPFASVTKPIVAWAALVAVDRGLLDLEAPAGSPAPDGATIENLLSHSSGIAADSDERLAAPGTRRIYSNRGIEILGERLEEATGTPLETWVETTVLEPLGMASVLIPGSPAHSGEGNARDLSLFARELAAPRLVSPALAQRAQDVRSQRHPLHGHPCGPPPVVNHLLLRHEQAVVEVPAGDGDGNPVGPPAIHDPADDGAVAAAQPRHQGDEVERLGHRRDDEQALSPAQARKQSPGLVDAAELAPLHGDEIRLEQAGGERGHGGDGPPSAALGADVEDRGTHAGLLH